RGRRKMNRRRRSLFMADAPFSRGIRRTRENEAGAPGTSPCSAPGLLMAEFKVAGSLSIECSWPRHSSVHLYVYITIIVIVWCFRKFREHAYVALRPALTIEEFRHRPVPPSSKLFFLSSPVPASPQASSPRRPIASTLFVSPRPAFSRVRVAREEDVPGRDRPCLSIVFLGSM